MDYGKKVMVIGGVRVTDAPEPKKGSPCAGCVLGGRLGCVWNQKEDAKEMAAFGDRCYNRNAIYIPAPDDLKEEA